MKKKPPRPDGPEKLKFVVVVERPSEATVHLFDYLRMVMQKVADGVALEAEEQEIIDSAILTLSGVGAAWR